MLSTYIYDSNGRRVRKSINGVAAWYLWDGGRLLAEFDASGNRTKRYAYLGSDLMPVQVQDANGTYFLHDDHLQTPRLATNNSGQVVWTAKYQAYGTAVVDTDPDQNGTPVNIDIRFPGQYYDAESGLHYNYMRNYDPATGRYAQPDPLGLNGGINTYGYALGDPMMNSDPTGEFVAPLILGIRVSIQVYNAYRAYRVAAAAAVVTAAAAAAANQMQRQPGHGGGDGCPPDDECKKIREALADMYQRWSQMPVGPPGSQARYDVLNLRRSFNDQVDAYNKVCGSSKAGPFNDKLELGPKGPIIPGGKLLEDFYTR